MAELDVDQVRVAADAVRKFIDASGYGHFVSDDQCRALATAVVQALDDYASGVIL